MSIVILGTSIVVQLTAAVLALRLIRVTGFLAAWSLIAAALALMALRRSITFYNMIAGDVPRPFNTAAEITALSISVLMLAGIYLIRPYFVSHREAHRTLKQSQAQYRDILANMSDTFYRTDNDGRLTIVSASVSELLGYTPNELIGKRMSDFYVNPLERDSFLSELRDNGRVTGYESLLEHKNGSHVLVETNSHLVCDDDGNEIGVEGLARNIVARKQAEQLNTRLGRIVEDSINEIYVFDSETLKFLQVNRGARENLGYTLAEVRELTPVDIKPDFDEDRFRQLIGPLRGGSCNFLQFETLHQRKDGSTYPVDVRLQLAGAEQPPVFFAIIQDITERKRTERELVQSQKLRAVGQLTGGISHDFNNLLTVILGNIELALGAAKLPDLILECLDASANAARKGAALTHRLLAFSRKQSLNPEIIDLEKLIQGMYELIRRSLRENIVVRIDCGAQTWPCEADLGQLENMLLNLAINANDAMPDGGELELAASNEIIDDEFASVHPDAAPGRYVRLSVHDTGHGMTPEVLEQAFEPFFTTKKDGEGTGLGLSMVYGFVKQSGGFIDIESRVNAGSTVTVYLPAKPGGIAKLRATGPVAEVPQGVGERVLVVEDNKNLLNLTIRMLSQLGYDAIPASNANAALEILQSRDDVDVMLTDVILRDSMNGAQLAEVTNRTWPDLKVLYMSGYCETSLNREGGLRTSATLLKKPFSMAELAQKVNELTCVSRTVSTG